MKKDDPNDSKHQSSPSTFQSLFLLLFPRKKKKKKKRKERRSRSSFAALSNFPISLSEEIPSEKNEKTRTKVSSGETPPVGTRTSCLVLSSVPPLSPSSLRLTEERKRKKKSPNKKEIHKKVFPIDKEYSHSVKSRSERLTRRGG